MNIEEQARERLAQQRQHEEHLEESILKRSEDSLHQEHDHQTDEQARELLAQKRQEEEHLRETMLNRSESEINP